MKGSSWRVDIRHRLGVAALALLLASGALAGGTLPEIELELRTPATLDTHTLGSGDGGVWVKLSLVQGASAQGPFTTRMALPPGVSYVGNNDPGNWACSVLAQELVCTNPNDLNAVVPSRGVTLRLDTDGSLPVPGDTLFRVTLESPELPLPGTPDCSSTVVNDYFATSLTGCVERAVPNRRSELGVASVSHSPASFLAGSQQNYITFLFQNVGFGYDNGPVTASVQLPPGFAFVSVGGLVGWSCSAQAANAQGQRVDCSTAYFYDGMPDADTRLTVQVLVDSDIAVPGPHPVSATIGNPQQLAPDMALCSDADPPLGCGHHQIPTALPPLPRMDIVDAAHAPAPFPRDDYGVLALTVANIGEAIAGTGDLQLLLPPGVAFDSLDHSQIPATSCSASGSVATGQTLACSFSSGLPNTGSYSMGFRLQADASAPSPARVVVAIGDSIRPGPSLATCSDDPDGIGCAEHFLDLSAWLFCDGFERIGRVCGQPQAF